MPSSTLIIMDVYLLYLSLWQEPEDMRGCEGEYRRVICQSNQILYTPLHSGMHTAETSGGPELNQAERVKKEATHEAYRATGWVQMESVKMEKRSERSIFYLCMLTLHPSPLAWWVQPFLCCLVVAGQAWLNSLHIPYLQSSQEDELADEWRKVGQASHRCIPSSRNLIHWQGKIHLSVTLNFSPSSFDMGCLFYLRYNMHFLLCSPVRVPHSLRMFWHT